MKRYSYNLPWYGSQTSDEHEKLVKKEEKLASQLNELGFATCSQCRKKLVRVFAPRSGRKPIFHDDVQDYLRRMRKTMKAFEGKGAKSECHISGPEYTIVYNSNHFGKPYADNLGIVNSHGHCGRGAFLGYSAIDVVSRVLLKHRMIRQACIANGVMPDEVRKWMSTVEPDKLGKLFGYSFELQEIKNTNLWVGTYAYRTWIANTIGYDAVKVVGPEWAAEMDPIISDPPPVKGRQGKYTMSPTHGSVQYGNSSKHEIAIDLPNGVKFTDLEQTNWDRAVDIKTSTGSLVKVITTHNGPGAEFANTMSRALHDLGAPRKFWVIQPWAYHGSSAITREDIIL